jgi:alpha-D-ribose 1-methylphosphonate 5-triphosphate synthase subunit PhnL
VISVRRLEKTFTLHNQGGVELPVLKGIDLEVQPGECVVLDGPSGAGKSTLLKCLYANYRASAGSVRVGTTEVTAATAQELLAMRRDTVGYVSQFLRVVPRVPALDVVAEPLHGAEDARQQAEQMLLRLRIPMRLWSVPPATFSGGEQQRINVARGFIRPMPVLLLDEPTASLDADNRQTVVALIHEALECGCAIVGIFHDQKVREAVATRTVRLH